MFEKNYSKNPTRQKSKPDNMDDGISCIDTYRILDSCKIKECAQNLRLYLSPEDMENVRSSVNIRVKDTEVIWTDMITDKMYFTSGFYQVNIRYYFLITLECCAGDGEIKEAEGLCTFDKSIVLYGGSGSVSVFKADVDTSFCSGISPSVEYSSKCPRAVIETADPIPLKIAVSQNSDETDTADIPSVQALPAKVASYFPTGFSNDSNRRRIFISLGIFSIVRMERPSELVIPACDFCIPKDEIGQDIPENDACSLFRKMEFPINEFCSGADEKSEIGTILEEEKSKIAVNTVKNDDEKEEK